jgi:hypothetical protein
MTEANSDNPHAAPTGRTANSKDPIVGLLHFLGQVSPGVSPDSIEAVRNPRCIDVQRDTGYDVLDRRILGVSENVLLVLVFGQHMNQTLFV